jgi:hypothetical protein
MIKTNYYVEEIYREINFPEWFSDYFLAHVSFSTCNDGDFEITICFRYLLFMFNSWNSLKSCFMMCKYKERSLFCLERGNLYHD